MFYLPSQYYKKEVLGTITTKPLQLTQHSQGELSNITLESEEYDFIGENDLFYICNQWHKEHRKVPLLILKEMVIDVKFR